MFNMCQVLCLADSPEWGWEEIGAGKEGDWSNFTLTNSFKVWLLLISAASSKWAWAFSETPGLPG